MSLDSFRFDYETREQKAFVARIQASIGQSSLVNQFIGALDQLTNPELLYQDYTREILANLSDREAFYRLFKDLYTNLIEETGDCSSQGEWGTVRRSFARHLSGRFKELFGEAGEKGLDRSIRDRADRDIRSMSLPSLAAKVGKRIPKSF